MRRLAPQKALKMVKSTLNLLKKSNNQEGWGEIKQSKSHEYHYPISLVYRIKTIEIPGKFRGNRKHWLRRAHIWLTRLDLLDRVAVPPVTKPSRTMSSWCLSPGKRCMNERIRPAPPLSSRMTKTIRSPKLCAVHVHVACAVGSAVHVPRGYKQ